jgi:hypothetical protein
VAVVFQAAAIGGVFWAAGWLGGAQSLGRLIWMLLVALWPITFVVTVVNVAIAASASAALDRRRMTVREALAVARERIGQIALWALFATGLGALLQPLARRRPFRQSSSGGGPRCTRSSPWRSTATPSRAR